MSQPTPTVLWTCLYLVFTSIGYGQEKKESDSAQATERKIESTTVNPSEASEPEIDADGYIKDEGGYHDNSDQVTISPGQSEDQTQPADSANNAPQPKPIAKMSWSLFVRQKPFITYQEVLWSETPPESQWSSLPRTGQSWGLLMTWHPIFSGLRFHLDFSMDLNQFFISRSTSNNDSSTNRIIHQEQAFRIGQAINYWQMPMGIQTVHFALGTNIESSSVTIDATTTSTDETTTTVRGKGQSQVIYLTGKHSVIWDRNTGDDALQLGLHINVPLTSLYENFSRPDGVVVTPQDQIKAALDHRVSLYSIELSAGYSFSI